MCICNAIHWLLLMWGVVPDQQASEYNKFWHFINLFDWKTLTGLSYLTKKSILERIQNIYAKAESPRLNLKAKASIWLVSHHLRSPGTVNERLHYEKHVYRKNSLCMFWIHFIWDARSTQEPCGSRLLTFLSEGCSKAETMLHFVDVICLGFKSILVL
jgi:hypothetical protein